VSPAEATALPRSFQQLTERLIVRFTAVGHICGQRLFHRRHGAQPMTMALELKQLQAIVAHVDADRAAFV
jgi:hypothetical protein